MTKMLTAATFVLGAACLACDRQSMTEPGVGADGIGGWSVTQGTGALTADGDGWRLALPRSPQTTNYVQAAYYGGAPREAITATFEVALSPDAALYMPGDQAPAYATLMLVSRSGERMWAGGYRVRMDSPGAAVVTVPLDWRQWTGVNGQSDEAAFDVLVANLGSVGVTFGGASFYGHGVGVQAGAVNVRLVSIGLT